MSRLPSAASVDTTRQAVVDAGHRILNDFKNQFTYQSSALLGLADHKNDAIDDVVSHNGIDTTGFQLGSSAELGPERVGAPGNPALALTLAIENGMQLNTNGKHADYIEVHADDFVDDSDPTNPQPILELRPVLEWAASLFDKGTLSLFDQTAFDATTKGANMAVDDDSSGNPIATMNGGSPISFANDHITSINVYPQIYVFTTLGEFQQPQKVNNIISNTTVPVTITDLPFPVPARPGYSGFNPSEDDIALGNSSDGVQGIVGQVAVNQGIASNSTTLTIDDSADSKKKKNVTITASSVTGLAPAPINYDLETGGAPVTINGGSGGNTFTVVSLPSQSMDLNTGSGNDTVIMQAMGGEFGGPGQIHGLFVNGEGGINTLVGPNAGSAWNITGEDSGTFGTSGGDAFSSFQNLTGGTGLDVFTLSPGGGRDRFDRRRRRRRLARLFALLDARLGRPGPRHRHGRRRHCPEHSKHPGWQRWCQAEGRFARQHFDWGHGR